MRKLLIIGGSDAGISAALRAKELCPATEVTVVVADRYPNFSICGLPFYLSGEVADWQALAHRTARDIENEGIGLLLQHTAVSIDATQKEVSVRRPQGDLRKLGYDRLILGTGAESIRPRVAGMDLRGVFLLRWMDDAFILERFLSDRQPKSATIVGAGYIGMEMADALTRRGMAVTVVEFADSVLTTLDKEMGQRVETELGRHGVRVNTRVGVTGIVQSGDQLRVLGSGGFSTNSDMVLVAVGAHPRNELALCAGIQTGLKGAIKVDRRMRTNVADIFAAGDCVETRHRLLTQSTYIPLGTIAHKQGRIAGENAVGGDREFGGSLGTQAVKIFDLVAGRTGLRDCEALAAGLKPLTVETEMWDHKAYYPGAHKLWVRITAELGSHRLLGAQVLGHRHSEVSKRVDVFAAAIHNAMSIEDLNDLDLSYTPPLSSPWDPVQMSAQEWSKSARLLTPNPL